MILFAKKNNLFLLYCFFLIVIFFYVVLKLYGKATLHIHEWTMSDWLVNYEDGGFKRRGITGTAFFAVQDLLSIPLPFQVFIVQIVFYILIFFSYYKLLIVKKIDWNVLVLLCSPLCFMYFPINLSYSGKREIILFALAAYFAIGKMTVFKERVFLVLFCMGLLIHEMFYFFLPFFIAIHIFKTGEKKYTFWMLFFVLSTIIMGIMFFFGKEINCGSSLEIIRKRGVVFGENNIFIYNFWEGVEIIKNEITSYSLFILELVIEVSMFLYYVFLFYRNKFYTLLKFIIASLIWVMPLYFLGIDWYRWNHIYSMLLLIIVIMSLPDNENRDKVSFSQNIFIKKLLVINILFFIFFFIHMQYDARGFSLQKVMEYYFSKFYS
ncbi:MULTISPECIES: hypothetical protein [Chryseobacterium]|uniref:hypothetical protein n=1 Tax=Chryseobacterium TaxID=59732 RepID=UPI000C9DE66B|nr:MULTISPECIES: hypothetical protein [Chryseobacterium]VXA99002.1 conserved membrane hypothetical protein [Chryseobacterium sp. 8AT]